MIFWSLWGRHDESGCQWMESSMHKTEEEAWAATPEIAELELYFASSLRLIVAGSRSMNISDEGLMLKMYEHRLFPAQIVSGTARGVDRCGESFGIRNKVFIKRFPADWDGLGRGAGHVRNKQMAEYADALLLVWDGKSKGSASMKQYMKNLNKPIYEIIV